MVEPIDYSHNAGAVAAWNARAHDGELAPYTVVWNIGDGDWTNADDWTSVGGGMTFHYVPGVDDAVDLVNGAYTVSYDAIDEIWSLTGGADVALDIADGSLTVDHASDFFGKVELASGASLVAAAGVDLVISNGAVEGTLGGDGEITLAHTFFLQSGVSLGVSRLRIGGNTFLRADLSYGGALDLAGTSAVLTLNGYKLTLTGDSNVLKAGAIEGGRLAVSGAAAINGDVTVDTDFMDFGSITMRADLTLGGELAVEDDAMLKITRTAQIDSTGAVVNRGALIDADTTGGTSQINGVFTSTQLLTVHVHDTLALSGRDTLAGAVDGAGKLLLGGGEATIATDNVKVGALDIDGGVEGDTTTLDNALAYAGAFDLAGDLDTLDLNGNNVTLSGSSVFSAGDVEGFGTLKITGEAVFNGSVTVANATIEDAGAMTQSGRLFLNGDLLIDAGGTDTFIRAIDFGPGALTINNGALVVAAPSKVTSEISGTFINDNMLKVDAGNTLELTGASTLRGAVSGAGALVLGGAATIDTSQVSVASLTIENGQTMLDDTLTLTKPFEVIDGGDIELINAYYGLTLKGNAVFGDGATIGYGDLTTYGATTISGAVTIGAGWGNEDGGTVTQDAGVLTLTYSMVNYGTYDLIGDADIEGGSINNQKLIEKTGGTGVSLISASVSNETTFKALSGTLDFGSELNGGVADVGAGATLEVQGGVDSATLTYLGSGGRLWLNDLDGSTTLFRGTISGFGTDDTLEVGMPFGADTILSYTNNGSSGVLQLSDDGHVASIDFTGDYTLANFKAPRDDGRGGALIGFKTT